MSACGKSTTLKQLNLGWNELHNLVDVVDDADVVCGLDILELHCNALVLLIIVHFIAFILQN